MTCKGCFLSLFRGFVEKVNGDEDEEVMMTMTQSLLGSGRGGDEINSI